MQSVTVTGFIKAIIMLLVSITCHNVYAAPLVMKAPSDTQCIKHPLACAIKTLQPALAGGEAFFLSNLIYKYSKKYNVDPYIVIAIAMQESGLRNINRTSGGIITDVGLYQFHISTIDHYNIDMLRLTMDIAYQTERACWLLSVKLKECSDLNNSWACWHSRTDKHKAKYELMVNKYYNQIRGT